ncbi:hypothetical protein AK88_05283 [Plasmodium fragile]|uniref:Uncharacterized protein n=1 Tax=Plasmodium fragile TaxID=5857 RepID=A0A0D9QE66_PLAFR|nr:uncharacterized protein AK88_05283 [Plasmodium fragile]KJP85092.1 hypothetical protein AK88_05283 [Plasmodium fragile]
MSNKSSSEKNAHLGQVPPEELHLGGVHHVIYTHQWGGDSEDASTNRARNNRVDAMDMIKTNEVSLYESLNDSTCNKLKNIHVLYDQEGVGTSGRERPNSIAARHNTIVEPGLDTDVPNHILNSYNRKYRAGQLPSGVTSLHMLEGETHAEDTLVINKRDDFEQTSCGDGDRDESFNEFYSWGDYNFFNRGMEPQRHIETAFCLGTRDTNCFSRVTGGASPPMCLPPNKGKDVTPNHLHKRECSFDQSERSPHDAYERSGYHYIAGGAPHVKSFLMNEQTHLCNVKLNGEEEHGEMGAASKGGYFPPLTNKCGRCSSSGVLRGGCFEQGREKLLTLNHLSGYEDNAMVYGQTEGTHMRLNLSRVPPAPIAQPAAQVHHHEEGKRHRQEEAEDTMLLDTVHYPHSRGKNPRYEYPSLGGGYKGESVLLSSRDPQMENTKGPSTKDMFDFPPVQAIHMNDTHMLRRQQGSVHIPLEGNLNEEGHDEGELMRLRTKGFPPNEDLNRFCIENELGIHLNQRQVSTGEQTFRTLQTDRGRNEFPSADGKRLSEHDEEKLDPQICDLFRCTSRVSTFYGGDPRGENPLPFIRGTKHAHRLPPSNTYQLNEFIMVNPPPSYFSGNELVTEQSRRDNNHPTEKNHCEDMHWGESTLKRDTHKTNEHDLIRVENMFQEGTVDVVRSGSEGGDTNKQEKLNQWRCNKREENVMSPPFTTNHALKRQPCRGGMLFDHNEEETVGEKRGSFSSIVTPGVSCHAGCLPRVVVSNSTNQSPQKPPHLPPDMQIGSTHMGADTSGGNGMEQVPYEENGRCTQGGEERGVFKDPLLYSSSSSSIRGGENPWAFQRKREIFTNNRTELSKNELTYRGGLFASPYRHEAKGTIHNLTRASASREGDEGHEGSGEEARREDACHDGTAPTSSGEKAWGNNPLALSLPMWKADKGCSPGGQKNTACEGIYKDKPIPRVTYSRRITNVGEPRNALKDNNVNLLTYFKMNFERGGFASVGSARVGVGGCSGVNTIGRTTDKRTPLQKDLALRPTTHARVAEKSNLFESVDAFVYNFKQSGVVSSGGESHQVEGRTGGVVNVDPDCQVNARGGGSGNDVTTNNCTKGRKIMKEDNDLTCVQKGEGKTEAQHLHAEEEEKLMGQTCTPVYEKKEQDGADERADERGEKVILTIQWNIKKISLLCSSDNYFVVSPEYKTETGINEFFILLNIHNDMRILVENSFDLLFSYTGFCDILFSVTCGTHQKKFCSYDFSTVPWFGFNKWGTLKNCMQNDSMSITVDIHEIRRKDCSLKEVFLNNVISSMRSNNGSFYFKEGTSNSSSVREKKNNQVSSSIIAAPSATATNTAATSSPLDTEHHRRSHKCFFPQNTQNKSDSFNKVADTNVKRRHHTGSIHMVSTRPSALQCKNKQTNLNSWHGKITSQENLRTNKETNPTTGNKLYKVMKKK